MFADCEGCHNLIIEENGDMICNRYGEEIFRINECEEWHDDEEE